MPEGRPFPLKFLPKPGVNLSVTFGTPVDTSEIQDALASVIRERSLPGPPSNTHGGIDDPKRPLEELESIGVAEQRWLGGALPPSVQDPVEAARIRSAVTEILRRDVERLGRLVVGSQKP